MTEHVGIAVVGTGDWGANLVRNFANLPGSRLVALHDNDLARLRKSAAQYPGARAVAGLEELLAMPDVRGAVVAASAVSHHALAKALLEAGKDVFVEKPLALGVAQAEELVRLARERDRILMVGHLLLYHPAVRHLKGLVERGELGELLYIYSQRVNLGKVRRDENALWSFAPHDLSVILHLVGAEPVDVVARGSAFLQKAVEDMKSAQKAEDGSFYYSKIGASHSTHSITAVAVLSLQLLGHANDSETQKGVDFLGGADCKWDNPPDWPMYAWYYISQTKFHKGGATWTACLDSALPPLEVALA